jgi:hypothetical protein
MAASLMLMGLREAMTNRLKEVQFLLLRWLRLRVGIWNITSYPINQLLTSTLVDSVFRFR